MIYLRPTLRLALSSIFVVCLVVAFVPGCGGSGSGVTATGGGTGGGTGGTGGGTGGTGGGTGGTGGGGSIGGTGGDDNTASSVPTAAVPEPATILLLITGAAGAAALTRKRAKAG